MADPLARACLFPTLGLPAITAVDVAIARCDESVCIPAYLMNLCNSFQVLVQAEAAAVGTTRKRISRKNLEEIQVGLPPLPEQKRIVNILEMLADKVDHCNARLRTITALLKRFRQSVLASACSGRLTADWRIQRNGAPAPDETNAESDDLPLGWKAVCVSDVIDDLKYGTSQKCGYEKRGVPVLRIPNVAKGVIDHNDIKYAELPAKEQKQLHLLPGDILIVRSNGSVSFVGKCALVGEHERGFSYAGYLIRIRPNQTIVSPEFLNLALSSYDVRLQIELQARSTSGVNNINSEEVRALRLSLPPLDEQEEIVRRVNKLFILADKIETRYKAVQQQVDHLPQSILAKAFRGELVPTEAELAEREGRSYESAEQLLQRIKYSRGTAPASIVKKRGKQPTSK
jgi:type I restriction enzyme S subunit